MGNYLLSLRVPPPTPEEDERNHPLYYDWTIPKWSPFLEAPKAQKSTELKGVENDGKKQMISVNGARDLERDIDNKAGIAMAKQLRVGMKDKLTSTIDTVSTKPPNLDTHKEPLMSSASKGSSASNKGHIAKSTLLHKNTNVNEAQIRQQSAKALKGGDSSSSIKRVDSTRPHSVDPKKFGKMEDSAAIKSATNIHAIKVAVKKSSSSSSSS